MNHVIFSKQQQTITKSNMTMSIFTATWIFNVKMNPIWFIYVSVDTFVEKKKAISSVSTL